MTNSYNRMTYVNERSFKVKICLTCLRTGKIQRRTNSAPFSSISHAFRIEAPHETCEILDAKRQTSTRRILSAAPQFRTDKRIGEEIKSNIECCTSFISYFRSNHKIMFIAVRQRPFVSSLVRFQPNPNP